PATRASRTLPLHDALPIWPLTHDLLVSILDHLGVGVKEIRVTREVDGIFHAEIELSGGQEVDARPSDAIAIALRAKCPVLCDERSEEHTSELQSRENAVCR